MKTHTIILTCGCNEETFSEALRAESLQKQINDIEKQYAYKIANISVDLANLRAFILISEGSIQPRMTH